MKIKSLTLENFKNQKKLHITFGDKATNIYGANGAGNVIVALDVRNKKALERPG